MLKHNHNTEAKDLMFRHQPIHGINAIPIVDLFLILLIIFMISVPSLYMQSREQLLVSLPESEIRDSIAPDSSLSLQVSKNGDIIFDNNTFKNNDWVPLLQENLINSTSAASQQITIHADEQLDHGSVIAIVNQLRKIGYDKIYIGVQVQ